MDIYSSYAPKYFDRGFFPVPLIGKNPVMKDWQKKETYKNFDSILKTKGNCNIGVLLGSDCGIIALDIDKEESLKDAPLSPVRKKGKKGETRFFKYNGELSKKRHDLGFEILSTGNQTVLPPSIHPENLKAYQWVTHDTLLDFDIADLPTIPQEFIDKINGQKERSSIDQSDGTRCNHGSHTKLSEMVVAALHNNDDFGTILKTLIDFDEDINQEVSYFLCTSRKWATLDKNTNALSFILEAAQRNIRKGAITKVNSEKIEINLVDKVEIVRRPLPCLRGIGHEMFQHAYDASYVARSHFTFPAVISIASILMGNKIKFQGIHPNIYCLLAGGSGSGKSSAMDFIKEFLQESDLDQKLLGDGSPSGDTALMQNLPIQRERIDILDEGDSLFLTINSANAYGKKVADVYASLFTSSGKYFAGKNSSAFKGKGNEMGNIGGCFSPYVNLIMGITFKAFEQSVTESVVDKGFGARILYFADNEKKRKKTAKIKPIPKKFIDLAKLWSSLEKVEAKTMNLANPYAKKFEIKEAIISEANQVILDKYLAELDERSFNEPQESKITALLERAGEYLKKMALIDAFLTQPNTTDLEITKCSLDWAMDFINVHLHNAKLFIDGHINQGLYNDKINKIYNYISFKKGVSKMTLSNNFQKIPKKERKELVQDLLEMGKIKEVDKLLFKV